MLQHILKVLKFAIPISSSMLVSMLGGFISMFFLGHLGEAPLAAGALAVPTYITTTMVSPIFYAIGILISYQRGQGNPDKEYIGKIVKNGFWLALTFSIPSAILLWNCDKILLLFGQNPDLVKLTVRYFHIGAFVTPPMLFTYVVSQFYAGLGHPRFSMIISAISLPFTILFSYILILGKFGFPEFGLAGMMCATLIVQVVTFCGVILFLWMRNVFREYKIFFGKVGIDFQIYKNIFKLGLPIGVQFFGELSAMTAGTYLLGHFGATVLAAAQITSQYSYLVVMVVLGTSQALSILTSESYGKSDAVLVKKYLTASIYILTAFFVVVLVVFTSLSETLTRIFIKSSDYQNTRLFYLAHAFFIIGAFVLYIDGIRNLLSSGLRGLHDSKAPMLIGVVTLWVISLPVSYFFGFSFHGGPIWMRIGYMSGFIIAVILLWKRMHHKIALI